MRFRELRQLLQSIVLAGLPVAAGGCNVLDSHEPCSYEEKSRILRASEPADAVLQLKIDSCRLDVDACTQLCGEMMDRANVNEGVQACSVTFDDGGVTAVVQYTVYHDGPNCATEGRRPAGLVLPTEVAAKSAAGAWLAQAAWMEAASVHAFVHLAAELAGHGAPRALVKLALAAAKDEVRHAQMVEHLAKRYGAVPPPVDVTLPAARSLEALAIENAAEGCVRETWGAVIALWQAKVSPDPEVRATFAAIAKDEIRHCALAWEIDAWVQPLLDDAGRARVLAAREAAARALFEGNEVAALVAFGLPNSAQAHGLLSRTYNSLWMGGLS
ncbi:MAG: hypothetical protein M4D80_08700 [Myxococcota bacterium]|nr:hypothetical protein [Myxococcota bacterium]